MSNKMREIVIITYRNKLYREALTSNGYTYFEFNQPFSNEDIVQIEKLHFNGIAIVEIYDDNIEKLTELVSILNKNSAQIIIVSGTMNNKMKDFFYKSGISDVIKSKNPVRIVRYIDTITKNHINM